MKVMLHGPQRVEGVTPTLNHSPLIGDEIFVNGDMYIVKRRWWKGFWKADRWTQQGVMILHLDVELKQETP